MSDILSYLNLSYLIVSYLILSYLQMAETISSLLVDYKMSLDKNEWVCGKCGFLNAEDGSDLVLCDGPCLGSFHLGCLDSITKKVPYDS